MRAGFQQVSKNLTFRSGTTYKAGGSFLWKNPLNLGDFFALNTDITRFYRYFSASYGTPWLLDYPLNTIVKGYANSYVQPIKIGDDQPLYRASQEGGLVGLSYQFQKGYVGMNGGVELMKISNLSQEFAQAINFEPQLIDQKVPYIFFEPTLFIDYLDNKVQPTAGSLTVVSCKGMYSWKKGSANFLKMQMEQSFFIPLSLAVLAVRARIGHIFNQELKAIMPTERFYLGGENSLRGYCADFAPPLGLIIEPDGKKKLVPQGGRSMFNSNIELRFPLYKNLFGAVFQDVGILIENALSKIDGNKMLAATGVGLRYLTPIGPVRFDIGWKWKKHEHEESRYAWFLTLGNAF
jgi:outer membrane protein assembly factor BamA